MDKNKKVKKIISILILIVIAIIISILMILININSSKNSSDTYENIINNEEQNVVNNETDAQEDMGDPPISKNYELTNTLTNVSDIDEYFIIKNIIDNFNRYCKNLTTTEDDIDTYNLESTGDERQKYIEEQIESKKRVAKEALYANLSKEYINEFNISKENITQKLGMESKPNIIIESMYVMNNTSSVSTYFVSGVNITVDNKTIFKIAIALDSHNGTFSIYPEEYLKKHNYDTLKAGDKLEISIKSIENKTYNTFEYETIEKSKVAEEYFNNYKNSMIYNLDNAYERLDDEYAKKRFGSKQSFNEYINENYESLITAYVSEYKVTSNTNYTEYKCIDINSNICIFRVYDGVTDYKVLLDDYTIMRSSVVSKYAQMNKISKANYHLENFIKQLNTKDYNAIYNNLDSTFKNNNFKDVNSLKKYIKNNFYNLNTIETKSSDSETYEYCVFECTLTNMEDTGESKELTVIINIGEGTDFTMSFSVE